jgi:hypothetical protein
VFGGCAAPDAEAVIHPESLTANVDVIRRPDPGSIKSLRSVQTPPA